MKKTFLLTAPRQDDARVRDKIRREVNKVVRRERQKELPEGFFRWAFDCRLGADEASAQPLKLDDVAAAIDRIAAGGAGKVFLEIVAVPQKRTGATQ